MRYVIFDDGFPVTQPDGLSRSDLIDPHAYAGIDVWRGPSSALFGNYATGGAINFRTYPGGAIDGIEYGVDAGSSQSTCEPGRASDGSGPGHTPPSIVGA